MTSEITSTARPTGLRLAGFACVAIGAVLAGVGATRAWATIGFAADTMHTADVPVHGTDIWEGKVVLFAVATALLLMIAMRLAGSATTRRTVALILIALGVVCVALPVTVAARSDDRFGGAEGLERYVAAIAVRTGLPEEVVREQLAEEFDRAGRVDLEPGLWITIAGGVLLVAGGVLGLLWVRREGVGGRAGAG